MEINDEKKKVVKAVLAGKNVFVTGSAGTGKSHLLDYLKKELKSKMHVTATTGVAAVNVGGRTLHSFAGVGKAEEDAVTLSKLVFVGARKRVEGCKILVVDEVSMLSAELLDKLNLYFQIIRKNGEFFGGMQVLFFGDFLQLPPVGVTRQDFAFESEAWEKANFSCFELLEVFRQKDKKFIALLHRIRSGKVSDADREVLANKRFDPSKISEGITPMILLPTNSECDEINEVEMEKLEGEEVYCNAMFWGDERYKQKLRSTMPFKEHLILKEGAQVMMRTNTYAKRGIVNGSMGVVIDLKSDRSAPLVRFSNGEEIYIGAESIPYNTVSSSGEPKEQLAGVTQIPLTIAYAVTIHKSQGQTIDYVLCDLDRIFADSQVYVAISRARSFDGLFIENFRTDTVFCNEKAMEFYRNLEEDSEETFKEEGSYSMNF